MSSQPLFDDIDDRNPVLRALTEAGGVATRTALVSATSRSAVANAVREGVIAELRRGLYGLPRLDQAQALAHASGGVLCLASAALYHGWSVKTVPELPHIVLPRGRKIVEAHRSRAIWHRADLASDEISAGVATGRELTLLQCLRRLPFDEALAVADSALRDGEDLLLRRIAVQVRGPGGPRVRQVAGLARHGSANAFESVLRAICIDVPGLAAEPQGLITSADPWIRPDLVDRDLRIVIEADSFAWHGDRAALRRDARRYDLLVADGWTVLRFAYEDVMFEPEFVRQVLTAVVARARVSTQVGRIGLPTASGSR